MVFNTYDDINPLNTIILTNKENTMRFELLRDQYESGSKVRRSVWPEGWYIQYNPNNLPYPSGYFAPSQTYDLQLLLLEITFCDDFEILA